MAFRQPNIKLGYWFTNNPVYSANRPFAAGRPEYLIIHSTGGDITAGLKRYVGPDDGALGINNNNNDWNRPTNNDWLRNGVMTPLCPHGFVGNVDTPPMGIDDDSGMVVSRGNPWLYQNLPYTMQGVHLGGFNGKTIGYEIVENKTAAYGYRYLMACLNLIAVEYKRLMELYNIPIQKVLSHAEAYRMGLASSNHGDPDHWLRLYDMNMDNVRDLIYGSTAWRPGNPGGPNPDPGDPGQPGNPGDPVDPSTPPTVDRATVVSVLGKNTDDMKLVRLSRVLMAKNIEAGAQYGAYCEYSNAFKHASAVREMFGADSISVESNKLSPQGLPIYRVKSTKFIPKGKQIIAFAEWENVVAYVKRAALYLGEDTIEVELLY